MREKFWSKHSSAKYPNLYAEQEKRQANIKSEGVVAFLRLVLISNKMEIEHFVLHAFTAVMYFAGC